MYEFSSKEVKTKFKKTEYGKKLNKMLLICVIVSGILFFGSCIAFIFIGAGSQLLSTTEDMLLNVLFGITAISVVITCYFDGKRDGAIEQYKLGIKKKNS